MDTLPIPNNNSRVGFHYYPDTLHFRDLDLQQWIPVLKTLNCSWLYLLAPTDRAIPENFITTLITNSIMPILQFNINPAYPPVQSEFNLLLNSYSKWGVRYILLYDRPNLRRAWSSTAWAQQDLVERFLDRFIPLATLVQQAGMIPVFPPLEPGGDYWDTTFLKSALESLKRRNQTAILDSLVLSAYARFSEKGLQWGAGGPERWPGAKPYLDTDGNEDQRGFYIFDWYDAIARKTLQKEVPILLLGVGSSVEPTQSKKKGTAAPLDATTQSQYFLSIYQLLNNEPVNQPGSVERKLDPVSSEVVSCCFWLLCAASDSKESGSAWFKTETQPGPVVQVIQQWLENRRSPSKVVTEHNDTSAHPIAHYLLLPLYEWGVSDWHLDVAKPFIKKHMVTIGFSVSEAFLAEHVTVIGGPQTFPEETLQYLRDNGCIVERISGDGTSIATTLAER
jgi:hypothetical protein